MDRPALENVDEDTAKAETEGYKMHEVDAATVLFLAYDFRVEEEEGVLDGPVAKEVEDVGCDDELRGELVCWE